MFELVRIQTQMVAECDVTEMEYDRRDFIMALEFGKRTAMIGYEIILSLTRFYNQVCIYSILFSSSYSLNTIPFSLVDSISVL